MIEDVVLDERWCKNNEAAGVRRVPWGFRILNPGLGPFLDMCFVSLQSCHSDTVGASMIINLMIMVPCPNMDFVSHTSNRSQHDISNHLGPYIAVWKEASIWFRKTFQGTPWRSSAAWQVHF